MNQQEQYALVKNLVGPLSMATFQNMQKNVEIYLFKHLSLFRPYLDYCDYAITPKHKHPSYSFIYNFTGPAEIRVQDTLKRSPFGNKSNICAFSPGIPHEEIIQDQFKSYIAICINKDFFENELALYSIDKNIQFRGDFFEHSELILNTLKRFIVECQEQLPCREKMLHALALEIVHLLIRHCHSYKLSDIKISQRIEINQLVGFLNEGFSKKITVDEMAKFVNLSPSHFLRIFKEEIGTTPIDFLNNLRVQKAKRYLLHKEYTITEIALACGFSSSSYFTNCFVERVGMAPGLFRKNQLAA